MGKSSTLAFGKIGGSLGEHGLEVFAGVAATGEEQGDALGTEPRHDAGAAGDIEKRVST